MPLRPALLLLPVLLLAGCAVPDAPPATALAGSAPDQPARCVAPGVWADASGRPQASGTVLERAARAPAVLLGERHDSAEQHRWQMQTLSQLHALNPHLAVALEMVPRSRQAVLDRWVDGQLGEVEFLRAVDWRTVWGFDPQFYLPILHFARMNRLPLVAANVDKALVSRTRKAGWAAIPEAEREGVGNPAAASEGYRDFLAQALGQHGPEGQAVDRGSDRFRTFVEAQLVWDRAMAERVADTRRTTGRTVVTIVGAGHAQGRFGIPHQLADLGMPDSVVLLPWGAERTCTELDGRIADAVFGLDAAADRAPPVRPRLGVLLEAGTGGVRVAEVQPDSLAAAAGLRRDDVVTAAAGRPVRTPGDVTGAVQAMAPGTWLPVTVRRGGAMKTVLVKFPAE